MDYSNIPSEVFEYCACEECGSNSAYKEIEYGYPSPSYLKDSRGYLYKNDYPSANIWLRCAYCGDEEPI